MDVYQIGDLYRDHLVVEVGADSVRLMTADGSRSWMRQLNSLFGDKKILGKSELISVLNGQKRISSGAEPTSDPEPGRPLLRDLLNRIQNIGLPYTDFELCHCRVIPTQKVIQAIWYGAKTTDDIARTSSAGTACGTCRNDSQKLLEYLK